MYVCMYTYSITTSIYHVFVSSAHRESGVSGEVYIHCGHCGEMMNPIGCCRKKDPTGETN